MSQRRIESISLSNFKCHRKEKIELQNLTILTGSNAAGKSSLVQGILLAKKSWNEVENKKIRTNDVYGINLGLPANIVSEDYQGENVELTVSTNGIEHTVILSVNEAESSELYFDIMNIDEILECNDKTKSDFKKINLFFLNAERIGPRIYSPLKDIENFSVGNKGENTSYTLNEIDKTQKLVPEYKLKKNLKISSIERFSANCEEWLKTIIPGTEFKFHVDNEKNIATIKYGNEGDFYLPTATGFGITYVLPIIVQSLVASMLENSVVIIENPEAHLHPYSQSVLGKFLSLVAACGVQVIIETHSEHIIDGCRIQSYKMGKCQNTEIIFFEKKDKRSSYQEIKILENGELEEWPSGFFDQKRLDLRELLEMRQCGK